MPNPGARREDPPGRRRSRPSSPAPELPGAERQAREAIAAARAALLTTFPRRIGGRAHASAVAVLGDEDGAPVVELDPTSEAVRHLRLRPIATVRVAPLGFPLVTVHGTVTRLTDAAEPAVRFRLEPAAVRLDGPRPVRLDVAEYRAATLDRIGLAAPAVLRHLGDCHAADLVACLRAQGHDVELAHPVALDRHGLDVVGLDASGARLIRLPFDHPVERLAELRPGVRTALTCRCRRGGRGFRPEAPKGIA